MPEWLANLLQAMTDFSGVLNTSISASWLILAVIAMRFLLKKAPRWVHVALWGIVALRLLMPVSIESSLSLIPSAQTVSDQILQAGPVPGSNPAYLDIVTNPNYGGSISVELETSISSFQWDLLEWNLIWLAGVGLMALYTGFSYWSLRYRVREAVLLRENVYQSERISSPFVLGVFSPRIYLPYHMDGGDVLHVVAHEKAHIRRLDHWWKPLGFLLLSVHWFNPLMWLAYVLLCRDIELACDEKVIGTLDSQQRADYTQALVACSISRRGIAACPLAFGEVGVKERVRNVMNYKKPGFWIMAAATVLCIVAAVCFLTDPPVSTLGTLPEIHSRKYGVVDLLYDSPWYSFSVVPQENSPEYMVTEQMELLSRGEISGGVAWTSVGKLTELPLTKENFDKLFLSEDGWIRESAAYIRKNTARAWYVVSDQEHLYYLLQWKNGEMYLAYGYYDYWEKDDPGSDDTSFRWLFCLAPSVDPNYGIYARSGDHSVPVTIFPAGTAVGDYKDAVHWLTVDSGDVPFRIYQDGGEITGHYLCFDAESNETVPYMIPSGLAPQTYLFQNCDPEREYIVVMMTSTEQDASIYTFGVRFGSEQTASMDVEYYLTVGETGVFRIIFKAGDQEAVLYKQDGTAYQQGERLLLERFTGSALAEGFQIRALDAEGNELSNMAFYGNPFGSLKEEVTFDDWIIAPAAIQRENPVLRARVLEIQGGYFLVEPVDGDSPYDRIQVAMKNMEPSPEPRVGDILEIEYDGMLQEVYPPILNGVYRIRVTEQSSPIVMVPTESKYEGIFGEYLYLSLEGTKYRYERQDTMPGGIQAGPMIAAVQEDSGVGEVYEYHVFQVEGCADNSRMLVYSVEMDEMWLYVYSPAKACAPDALEEAKASGWVVMEDGAVTCGQDIWAAFYESTLLGKPASVTVCRYAALDPDTCSEQYYEVYREDYPSLSIHELTYNGDLYMLQDSSGGEVRYYEYLMRYTEADRPPEYTRQTGATIRYVLTNDDTVSWGDLWNGMFSSQAGAYIDHYTVYTEFTDSDLVLRYCMEQFEQGILEELTFDSTGAAMELYRLWCGSRRLTLENVVLTPQEDWRDWSEYVRRMYVLNGYEEAMTVIFDETMVCERLYVQMLAE